MATFLDVTGLQHFTNIFVFLFVWLVVYATLMWTKVLGDNKFIHLLGGLLLAIFVLLSEDFTSLIEQVAPFITVVFVLILFLNMAAKMLGGEMEGLPSMSMKGIIIVFLIFIILSGIALRLRQEFVSNGLPDLSTGPGLFFHPTFLGTVLILAIAVFTIALLAARST